MRAPGQILGMTADGAGAEVRASTEMEPSRRRAKVLAGAAAYVFLPGRGINGTPRSAGSLEGTGCCRSPPLRPRSSRRNRRTKAPSRRARSLCESSHNCCRYNQCSSSYSKTVQPSSRTRLRNDCNRSRQSRSTTGRRPRRTTCGDSPVRSGRSTSRLYLALNSSILRDNVNL